MKKYYIVVIVVLLAGGVAFYYEPSGWLGSLCVTFLLGFVMMYYATHNILNISYQKKLFDLPDDRRIHKTPTSRLGGFAFPPIIVCSVLLTMALHSAIAPSVNFDRGQFAIWICALTFIHAIGTVDDLIGVRNIIKLSTQIIASIIVVYSGIWINDLYGIFGIHALPAYVGMPLTALFIVFIINAYNLIDGMDGLAAGLGMLAMVIYGVYGYLAGRFFVATIAFATLGVLMPFFYANVWGYGSHRHKLFMGDTGSQTIGLVVSILFIRLVMNTGSTLAMPDFALLFSPMLVPAFDVMHVVIFRLANRKNPFSPDMTHIHHRLLKGGLNPRRSILSILFVCLALLGLNTLLAPYVNVTLILVLDLAVWCIFNGAILQLARRGNADNNTHSHLIKHNV